MGRRPCCVKEGVNRGAWSAREDLFLVNYINIHGEGKWRDVPQKSGLRRCGKSCRLRWLNYLRPDIKRGNISVEEEELIIRLHKLLGNRWSLIAGRLPGRTDNEIKNYWNTNLCKKLQVQMASQQSDKELNKSKGKKVMDNSLVEEVPKGTHVIRTKAARCTKVILPPQEGNQVIKKNVGPTRDWEDLSYSTTQQDDESSNFLMDFNIGELFISDVQNNSDFLPVCGNGIQESDNLLGIDDGSNKTSSCSFDHPFSTYEAMLKNWKERDHLQPNEASDLKTLASFLDSEDE